MTNPISTLTCPSCGGKLQIVKGVDRFACGHCGNEHIVKRESGIVYLEPIAEDIHHIRTGVDNLRGGVDKTAAELAIVRLQKELTALELELNAVRLRKLDSWKPQTNIDVAVGAGAIVFFVIAVNNSNPILWLIVLGCFIASLILWAKRDGAAQRVKNEDIKDIQAEINDTKAALARNRKLV